MDRLKGLSDLELVELLKKCSMSLLKDYKAKLKAEKFEFELSHFASRARQTTAYANSYKANKSYQDGLEFIKLITKKTNMNFWKRLKKFTEQVEVNDPMSEEEKQMIINQCDKQIKLNKLNEVSKPLDLCKLQNNRIKRQDKLIEQLLKIINNYDTI